MYDNSLSVLHALVTVGVSSLSVVLSRLSLGCYATSKYYTHSSFIVKVCRQYVIGVVQIT